MPSQKQEFSFPGKTTEQLLLIAYGTFLELGWTPRYAGPTAIIGYTPRSWNKYEDEILVEANDGSLFVTSSLVHNESFDMMGKNKKHIKEFMAAFEKIKASESKPEWAKAVEQLRTQTVQTVTEETKEAEEIDNVMRFSKSNLYLTYGIIAINIVVFILMAINGAGIFEPDGNVHARWGSNYSSLTLSGDWWRLITSVFIHFGIFHLLLNMYALYMAGVYLEPMLGKAKFLVAYLCTGVIANLISLWWHNNSLNGAGASGAIFGMYGVFLGLLLTNLIPKQVRGALLQSIGVFIVLNIIYGFQGNVDNSAHIGGLLSGAVIGFLFYPLLKKQRAGIKENSILGIIIGATVLSAWMYLNSPGNKVNAETRRSELKSLEERSFPDGQKFFAKYNEFSEADQRIAGMLNDNSQNYGEWLSKYEKNMEKEITEMEKMVSDMKKYKVSETSKRKIDLLGQFLNTRKEEILTLRSMATENDQANRLKLGDIRQKQGELVSELNKNN